MTEPEQQSSGLSVDCQVAAPETRTVTALGSRDPSPALVSSEQWSQTP